MLRELNESLHEASQPMTVLLCTLEYGGSLDSMEEMKQMIAISQEACERLRVTVRRMQARVREAIEEKGATEREEGNRARRGQQSECWVEGLSSPPIA